MKVDAGGSLVVEPFKERVNYIVENGAYIGAAVNFPIVCESDSLDGLIKKMKIMCEIHVKFLAECISQDMPFEMRRLTLDEWDKLK